MIQGEHRGRVGFVRRGDAISVSSTDQGYHLLRGRGDAFFGLALPESRQPVTRTLTKAAASSYRAEPGSTGPVLISLCATIPITR